MSGGGVESGRNILVTGGTSGLGRGIATGFAAAGHNVMICARSQANCEQVAREISTATAGTCHGVACDLSRLDDIDALSRQVTDRFGPLHVLVNSAGAVGPGTLAEVQEDAWDRVIDTNLKAVFFLTQKLASNLYQAAQADWPAAVINIGSFAGSRVGPRPHYPYTASKSGLRYLGQSLAKELADRHVNVNTIALGVFPEESTMMGRFDEAAMSTIRSGIPAGRFGTVEDILGLTQFLSSRASAYITGATIPLDGGMHI